MMRNIKLWWQSYEIMFTENNLYKHEGTFYANYMQYIEEQALKRYLTGVHQF